MGNKKASKKKKKLMRKNKKAAKKDKKLKRKNKKASKKDRKSKRKNNKASKKDRKSERKNKKASKKDRKNKKRKSKQNKKKNSRKAKSQEKNREGRSTVPDTCITTAVDALYNGGRKRSNFDRQLKRIQTRLPKIESKRGKASEYNQTLDDLVAANVSCPAGNVTELDALVAILSECQTNIETACAVPEYNQTQIDECQPIVEGFQSEVEKCVDLIDPAAACVCWESPELAALEEGLKDRIIKPSEANVTAAFKACKGAVSDCNKAESDAIPVLVACSKSESDLVTEAETVANNIAALEGAKTAVEAVATSRRHRAAATNCTEFIALVDALLELSPESSEITDVAEDIVESDVTCTDDEKTALTESVAELDTLIDEAEAAYDAIQAAIKEATGSTAAIETTPLVAVTTAATGRRVRGFMKQLNFRL